MVSRTHLAGVFDSLYSELATSSRVALDDAVAVRLFVASRVMGDFALRARGGDLVPSDSLVRAALEHAREEDSSGVFTLYVFTMVLAPRLLVSLRDDLARRPDEATSALWAAASEAIIGQISAMSRVMERRPATDSVTWAPAARSVVETLESAGYSDHLGPRR